MARIIAIAALIATTGLALQMAQAQQVGSRRVELQRHDLSVPGGEVIQVIVQLEPGTTAPRHSHPGEEIIYVLEGAWEYTLEGKPPVIRPMSPVRKGCYAMEQSLRIE